jgi:hypothetical protein
MSSCQQYVDVPMCSVVAFRLPKGNFFVDTSHRQYVTRQCLRILSHFVSTRFMGDKGKDLLNYVYCSNGPQTGSPMPENKQCASKDYVVWTACLFLADVFKRYDDIVQFSFWVISHLQRQMYMLPTETGTKNYWARNFLVPVFERRYFSFLQLESI